MASDGTSVLLFDLGQVVLTNDWQFACPEKDREFENAYGKGIRL